MILRSIATSLILCLIYSAGLAFIPAEFPRIGATSHQENVVRAEVVVFKEGTAPNMVVGSSLSERMRPEFLGDQFESLAMMGSGAQTGIELLKLRGTKPRRLFVESNVLSKEPDDELLDYFTSQPMAWFRRWLPLLRQSSQPGNFLFSWYRSRHPDHVIVVNEKNKRLGIEALKVTARKPLNEDRINAGLEKAHDTLDQLRQAGMEIVLVEFPISEELSAELSYQQYRELALKKFPEREWIWIRGKTADAYDFTDGLHFDSASAKRFAEVLRETVRVRDGNDHHSESK